MNLWMMLGDHATTREAVRCTRSTDNPVAILGEYPDSATALEGLPRLQDDGLLLEATGTFGEGAEWRSIRGTHSESPAWRWRRITDPAPSLSKAWSPYSILRRFQAPDLANWSRQLRSADAWTPHTTACQQLASAPQRPAQPASPLSDRERTILELLVSGRTYQEISDRLTISKCSIHAYMARIRKQFLPQFRRPGVQSKRRLVVKLLP